ncbi:MAG: hypothetical protein JSS29_19015 [Proteobacteria bacterium]|nr:hypothetical protein [Pseudomonadota bacterium]
MNRTACAVGLLVGAVLAGAGTAHGEDAQGVVAAAQAHDGASVDPARAGIWKAAIPPAGSMRGEFDSNDPIGVMAGARIWADCSINWTDPDDRRLYCFSSATSLVYFLESPQAYLRRARARWPTLAHPVS